MSNEQSDPTGVCAPSTAAKTPSSSTPTPWMGPGASTSSPSLSATGGSTSTSADQGAAQSGQAPWAMGVGPGSNSYAPRPYQASGHSWTWSWQGNGQAVVVTGGSSSVNTDDLHDLAAAISSAAQSLNQAATHACNARKQVKAASLPAPPATLTPNTTTGSQYPAAYISPGSTTPGTGPDPNEFKRLKDAAKNDLDDVIISSYSYPSPSLGAVATRLAGIADDVLACAAMYESAECQAAPTPRGSVNSPATPLPVSGARGLVGLMLQQVFLKELEKVAASGAVDQVLDPQGSDEFADVAQGLATLLSDPGTSLWVKQNLLRLAALGFVAARASTGREAATVQKEVRDAAQVLDPWVKERLPDKVRVGTQLVDTDSLSPVQRCTYYLSLLTARSAQLRYGKSNGIEVSERSTVESSKTPVRTMNLPPSAQDPFGLKTSISPTSPQGGGHDGYQEVPPPSATISGTISFSNHLQNHRHVDPESAAISIRRITHVDGRKSYLVTIPGTVDWGSGSPAVQDLLTNTQAAAGAPTDIESGVVTAMRAAGIQPGDEVALYGHSQGGITAVNIASDPEVAKQFNITTVLTAGSPTANVQLPEKVHALHLENTGDAVPAMSGGPTPTGPNRTVVQLDTHQAGIDAYPHGAEVYAQVTQGLEEAGEPAVTEWSKHYRQVLGEGEQATLADGTVATATSAEVLYDIRRTYRTPNPQPGPPPQPPSPGPATEGG